MKIVKTMFLVSLFNFILVGTIVLATDKLKFKESTGGEEIETITVTPTVSQAAEREITFSPTETKRPKSTKIKDPFSVIFEGAAPTEVVVSQNNNSVPTKAQNPTTPPAIPTTDNRCIISIDGVRYDVTVFRTIHSGGDIFQCGGDMSSVFHSQHPISFLNKLAKYKI